MPPISTGVQTSKTGQSGLAHAKCAMSENDLASLHKSADHDAGLRRGHGSLDMLSELSCRSPSPVSSATASSRTSASCTPARTAALPPVAAATAAAQPPCSVVGDWVIQSKIGSGHSSSVYAAAHSHHRFGATMKVVDMIRTASVYGATLNYNQVMQRMYEEASIMSGLKHQNIVSIFEAFVSKQYFYICMEYIHGSVLLNYMRADGMTEDKVRVVMMQLLDALAYLHSRDIVHGDVKGENILLDERTGHITLIDFGFARQLVDCESVGAIGWTRLYSPPEAFETGQVSKAWDMWSCGVVMYALLTGLFPFREEALANKAFPSELIVPGETSNEAIQLLTALLRVSPNNRISASEALRLPFFQRAAREHRG